MNIVFAGTPAFAVPSLEALRAASHTILAVYTQPDRPAGRGRKLTESPIKQFAKQRGLTLRQPAELGGEAENLARLNPDVMVVIAYGLILPAAILEIPKHGCINVHASLLPRWRGAAPIPRAIEAGDSVTGISIMQIDAGLDTGPVLARAQIPIRDSDTAQTLHDRLAQLGAQTLVTTLEKLERANVRPQPQDEALACYARKLRKNEAPIDWSQSALTLHRKVRALNPWPVASTTFKGKGLRLWEVGPLDTAAGTAAPGTVLSAQAGGIQVQTGEGILTVTRLQAEGGRPLAAADFLNGTPMAPGDRLE